MSPDPTPRTHRISDFKDVYHALFAFAKDHDGLYPCEETGPAATAEDCFNQLLASGYLENEEIFWCAHCAESGIVSKEEPNNDGVLTAAENSLGYVKGLTTSSRTRHPIFFSTKQWDEQTIIAKLDGSCRGMPTNGENETGKYGSVLEIRGAKKVDIFEELPEGTTILLPQMAE